jgi:hypothetical protein
MFRFDILDIEQKNLLPLIRLFGREFYLVGGTAIALQIGHRKSVDFDLFKKNPFVSKKILNKIDEAGYSYIVTRRVNEQLNLSLRGVKVTFFEYPYSIETEVDFDKIIRMPNLLTLSAMKAFALGKRSKWKDYVDLYFLLKDYFTLEDVIRKAESIYGQEFSGKLFRSQLAYHKDIDFSEEVDFMEGYKVEKDEIKNFLIEIALQ